MKMLAAVGAVSALLLLTSCTPEPQNAIATTQAIRTETLTPYLTESEPEDKTWSILAATAIVFLVSYTLLSRYP